MKKFFKVLSLALVATTLSFGFTACSDDEEEGAAAADKNQVTVTFGDNTWSANYVAGRIVDGYIAIDATSKSSMLDFELKDAEGTTVGTTKVNFPMLTISVKEDEGSFDEADAYVEYFNTEEDSRVLQDEDGDWYLWGWAGENVMITVSELSSNAATINVSATMKQLSETGEQTGVSKALTATFKNITLVEAE